MIIRPSNRMSGLTTSVFSEVAEKRRQVRERGVDVIDLSIGSPDLPPAPVVMEALAEHISDVSNYGYTLQGIPSFHQAVSDFYRNRYGVSVDAGSEVLQLMGSQDGLAHLALALVDEEDYVLVPDPGYPIYAASVEIAGAKMYPMPLTAENGFLPVYDDIPKEVLRRARLMILNYPGNPVTALADEAFFRRTVEFAKTHNIVVVHDFAYSELVFDGKRPVSFLSVDGAKEVGIEINSLSKTFNMAGCRIGYALGNAEVLRILATLKSHVDYGIFYPIQKAAEAALKSNLDVLDEQVKTYEGRRDALTEGLSDAGWNITKSPATMFIWARIPDGWTSRDFAFGLLEATGVVVTPGDAFGREGEGYVRIALVQPEERLREAAKRVASFLRQ